MQKVIHASDRDGVLVKARMPSSILGMSFQPASARASISSRVPAPVDCFRVCFQQQDNKRVG